MATGYQTKVEYSDDGTVWTAITGKVSVKAGDITINQVDMPDLETEYVKSTPGVIKYEPLTLDVQDIGTNYSTLAAIATAPGTTAKVKKWRFTRGPAATGDTTLAFDGYIASVGGATFNQDSVPTFSVTIKPTGAATLGTVS